MLCNSLTAENACLLRLRKKRRGSYITLSWGLMQMFAIALWRKGKFSWISFMLRLDVSIYLKCYLLKKCKKYLLTYCTFLSICVTCNFHKFHKFVSIKPDRNYFTLQLWFVSFLGCIQNCMVKVKFFVLLQILEMSFFFWHW